MLYPDVEVPLGPEKTLMKVLEPKKAIIPDLRSQIREEAQLLGSHLEARVVELYPAVREEDGVEGRGAVQVDDLLGHHHLALQEVAQHEGGRVRPSDDSDGVLRGHLTKPWKRESE